MAGSVTRVNDHRQMAEFLDHRNGGYIQREANTIFKCSDSSLTQDDLAISFCQHVISRCEPLGNSARETSFDDDRSLALSDLGEQREILHVAGPYLEDVGVFGYQADIVGIHHLCN